MTTTYLTQALVDYATAARARPPLRDIYDWHQAAWKAFPGRDGQQRDFLTRLDHLDEQGQFRLLVVSPIAPVRPDWCPAAPENWKTKPIPDSYFARQNYRFQLRANPTKKVAADNPDGTRKANGRRVPLLTREELVAWLVRKGTSGGFSVRENSLRILRLGREAFEKQGTQGIHSAMEFEGALEVTDARLFHETFAHGIGSAKAFGFGLLVIAPISGA